MIVRYTEEKVRFPPPVLGLNNVDNLNILGVTISCHLTHRHIANLSSNQALYALKIIKSHGISHNLTQTLSTYVAPLSNRNWPITSSPLEGRYRCRMWDDQAFTINDMFRSVDDKLFQKVLGLSNPAHVGPTIPSTATQERTHIQFAA